VSDWRDMGARARRLPSISSAVGARWRRSYSSTHLQSVPARCALTPSG
jgi:hypothetical protein